MAGDMGQAPEEDEAAALPRDLRFLKTLVTVLTVVMIAGVITITALLVIRLNGGEAAVTIAPGDFEIPDGVGVVGLSVIDGRTVLVGDDGVIRVYDSESRALREEFVLDR
jgi:uncharacterized integral membrane protein